MKRHIIFLAIAMSAFFLFSQNASAAEVWQAFNLKAASAVDFAGPVFGYVIAPVPVAPGYSAVGSVYSGDIEFLKQAEQSI